MIRLVEILKPNGASTSHADLRMGWRLSAGQVIEELLADHRRLS